MRIKLFMSSKSYSRHSPKFVWNGTRLEGWVYDPMAVPYTAYNSQYTPIKLTYLFTAWQEKWSKKAELKKKVVITPSSFIRYSAAKKSQKRNSKLKLGGESIEQGQSSVTFYLGNVNNPGKKSKGKSSWTNIDKVEMNFPMKNFPFTNLFWGCWYQMILVFQMVTLI